MPAITTATPTARTAGTWPSVTTTTPTTSTTATPIVSTTVTGTSAHRTRTSRVGGGARRHRPPPHDPRDPGGGQPLASGWPPAAAELRVPQPHRPRRGGGGAATGRQRRPRPFRAGRGSERPPSPPSGVHLVR